MGPGRRRASRPHRRRERAGAELASRRAGQPAPEPTHVPDRLDRSRQQAAAARLVPGSLGRVAGLRRIGHGRSSLDRATNHFAAARVPIRASCPPTYTRGTLGGCAVARRRRPPGSRHQVIRRDGRRRRPVPRRLARRVLLPPRPVGLRQDHHPADDRRLRGDDQRNGLPGRYRRHRPAAVQAQRQHGLPELRPLPAPDHLRERGVRPPPAQGPRRAGQDPGRADAARWSSCRVSSSESRPSCPAVNSSAWPWPGP